MLLKTVRECFVGNRSNRRCHALVHLQNLILSYLPIISKYLSQSIHVFWGCACWQQRYEAHHQQFSFIINKDFTLMFEFSFSFQNVWTSYKHIFYLLILIVHLRNIAWVSAAVLGNLVHENVMLMRYFIAFDTSCRTELIRLITEGISAWT